MGEGEIRKDNMHDTEKQFAQELRKDSTPEEKKVWKVPRSRTFSCPPSPFQFLKSGRGGWGVRA
jgi:very-short-patch-repair endonuclease